MYDQRLIFVERDPDCDKLARFESFQNREGDEEEEPFTDKSVKQIGSEPVEKRN